jgi:hypothetical protein
MTYTQRLITFVNSELKDSQLKEEAIKKRLGNGNFDISNLYFLRKICNEEEQDLFQILIPDKYYKEQLMDSVLESISIIKYLSNMNDKSTSLDLKIGDVYNMGKLGLLSLSNIIDNQLLFEPVRKNKRERDNPQKVYFVRKDIENKVKLRNIETFNYTSHSGEYLESYYEFYENVIINAKKITSFRSKVVIIASSDIINNENKLSLPFRYNLEKSDKLPVETLVEVFNTYEQARDYLKTTKAKIDEVVIIGFQKYQNVIGQVLNDKNKGLFNKLILIGSKKVNDNSFKFWQWTNKEIRLLSNNHQIEQKIEKELVSSKQLGLLKKELETLKNDLQNYDVLIKDIDQLNNYFLNLFFQQLSQNHNSLYEYVKYLFDDANDLDEILANLKFSDRRHFKERYLKVIKSSLDNFDNGKLEAIKNLKQTDKFYKIVVPKRQKEEFSNLIEQLDYKKHEVLTTKELEKMVQEGTILNPLKTVFIIPYVRFKYDNPLAYYHLYHKIRIYGEVKFLCYSAFEEERLEMFNSFYKKQELYRLKQRDRKWFVDFEFISEEKLNDEEVQVLDTIASIETNSDDNTIKKRKLKTYFRDKYNALGEFSSQIKFDDDDGQFIENINTDIKNGKAISYSDYQIYPKKSAIIDAKDIDFWAKKRGRGYESKRTNELVIGDTIIVDWDIDLKLILKVLKNYKDFKQDIREIEQAGRLWQKWLNGLLQNYMRKRSEADAKIYLYKKLNLSVQQPTFEKWLISNDAFLFPRSNSDLENIINLKRESSPNKEQIDEERKKLKKGSTSLLYQIKRELNSWICDNKEGIEILNKLKPDEVQKLISKKQLDQIKNIIKL